MFGAGYASAQDRLFLMDVLRHVGRGELTPFAGGAPGNQSFEQEQWAAAPYTEADLQRQYDQGDDLFGADGKALQEDVAGYVAGVNQYLADIKAGKRTLPGEYTALGRGEVDPWKVTDVIATASLVGAVFGKGGGGEVRSALALLEAQAKYGTELGTRIWETFRAADDPEAPTTVHNGDEFPYGSSPANAPGKVLPQRGTVVAEPSVINPTGARQHRRRRPRAVRPGFARQGAGQGHVQRARGLRPGERERQPAGGLRPAGRVLRAAAADGDRPAGAGHQLARRRVRRREPVRDARARSGLRVQRDLRRSGHHRHVRRRPVRAERCHADDEVHVLPVPRPVPADRGAAEAERVEAVARRLDPGRRLHAHRPAHQAGHRAAPRHGRGPAGRVHHAPLDVPARG